MIPYRRVLPLLFALFILVLAWAWPARPVTFEVPQTQGMQWFKGNTHTHTTNSDGDSPPEYVARWYKEHGYDFLVLSDHNFFTDPATLSALVDSTFLLIPGEEVTTGYRRAPVHINGLNLPGLVVPIADCTLVGTIQKNIDAVRTSGGVPHINHPNFRWAFNHETLLQIERDRLLEIFNGHPLVNNFGGGGWPGMEEVWDHLLTAGKRIYGIAVDDAHHFQGEFAPHLANPGRGWVVVRASRRDPEELMRNLEAGLFYASTGVTLKDVVVEPNRLSVLIQPAGDFRYETDFIGSEGRILATSLDTVAVYPLTPGEPYVRAKVRDSGGAVAWVQPVFAR